MTSTSRSEQVPDFPGEPLVAIFWRDANGDALSEVNRMNVDEAHAPAMMLSVGWIVKQNEEGILLCAENYQSEEWSWRGRTYIPAEMVVKVVPLKPTIPRKKRSSPPPPTAGEAAPE